MMRQINKKLINILAVLLIVSTGLSVYALLGKHRSAAPIFLFMYNKNTRHISEDSLAHPRPWDNYPYYVLISSEENIHLLRYIDIDTSTNAYKTLTGYMAVHNNIFYRFHYFSGNDSLYKQTLNAIRDNKQLLILTDNRSKSYLYKFLDSTASKDRIFTIKDHLPIYVEKPGLSYFFRIAKEYKVKDLYVPRKELPEVTLRYLSYFFTKK